MKRNMLARTPASLLPAAVILIAWVAVALIVPAASPASAAAPATDPAATIAVRVKPATGWQGRGLRLQYLVDDPAGATATVVLTVSDAEGVPLLTTDPLDQSAGEWHAVTWRPPAAGQYSFVATAEVAGDGIGGSGSAAIHALALSRSVAGRSLRGRPIAVTTFGGGDRRLLLLGGVHGDEYGTPVARALERYLLAHPRAMPAGASIDLVACANPDGLAARTRANARRVDLNRNLPSRNWRSRLRAQDASSLLGLSGGRAPGSEPETRAVLDLLATRYDAVVSLHSRAGVLDCSGPGSKALGRRMSALCGLPLGTLWYDPYITGSLGRYVPEKYGIPIVTVELRSPTMSSGMCAALLEAAR
jgi:murein peptide amidase A